MKYRGSVIENTDEMNITTLSVSVVIPCYNEEGNLERVVNSILEALPGMVSDFELIIVNDGSSDRTGEIAERLSGEMDAVRVIHHPVNQGYGAALKSGYYSAKKELTCLFPGDGQFDILELRSLLEVISRADIAATFRIDRRDPFYRSVNQFLYNTAIRVLFGIKLKDIDCGFKLMKTGMFRVIDLETSGALIDAEFYFKSRRKGFTYEEIGVRHYPRVSGRSTGSNLKVILFAAYEIIRFWWRIRNYQ